jgi:hypothetical protein
MWSRLTLSLRHSKNNGSHIEKGQFKGSAVEGSDVETSDTKSPKIESSDFESKNIKHREIESSEMNSTDNKSNEIDSNEIDSNEIDSNEIDSNEIDSNEIDSNEIDSNEINSKETKQSDLCSHHQNYNLMTAFVPPGQLRFDALPRADREIRKLKAATDCSLCRLIIKVLSNNSNYCRLPADDQTDFVDISWTRFGRYYTDGYLEPANDEQVVRIARLMLELYFHPVDNPSSMILCKEWIQIYGDSGDKPASEEAKILRGRQIGSSVNISLLQSWLHDCDTVHGRACKGFRPEPLDPAVLGKIRLIDIPDRKLVSAQIAGSCHYAALSYTWGPTNVAQLKLTKDTRDRLFAPEGLSSSSEDIPTTIKDAMDLCQSMRIPYLWVDALCIQQDSAVDREQFELMDQIYGAAYVTIVAAAGNDSWAGLSGFRPDTRTINQETALVAGMTLGSCQPWFSESMNTSKWTTRAWTLQENFLSRRLLMFTPEQVYFQCHSALWLEDVCLEGIAENAIVGLADDFTNQCLGKYKLYFKSPLLQRRSFDVYASLVEDFTARSLTYQSDTLRAFYGISTILEEAWGTKFYNGIPTRYLESALLFSVEGDAGGSVRRPEFPSWSWAGWKSAVSLWLRQHDVQDALGLIGDCMAAECVWYLPHPDAEESAKILIEDISIPGAAQLLPSPGNGPPSDSEISLVDQRRPDFLPLGIEARERMQLLICRTTTAWRAIDLSDTVRRGVDTQAQLSDKVEHLCFAKDPERNDVPEYHHQSFWVLPIHTDERGVSYRVANPYSMTVSDWIALKPIKRIVYLA